MATTKVPRDRLLQYFDAFSKRYLADDAPETIDIELLDRDLGDQQVVRATRLVGITYDRQANTLEFALESGDHRVVEPEEVWVEEEDDGFVSAIEVVRPGGAREIVNLSRA